MYTPKRTFIYSALVVVIILLHFSGTAKLSIYALDEAKNAVAAFEMYENNDYLLPKFNDQPRYDKPPLHYYFFIIGYKIFGYNPFGARFFPALAGLLCMLVCAKFVKAQFGHRATFFFLLLIAANIHWMVQFHMAVPDPFLILFLTTSYLYGFKYYESRYQVIKYQYYSYLLLGLAVLSKGPVALLLYIITFILFMLFQKRLSLKPWFRFFPVCLFILVAGSWYALVGLTTDGNWLGEFFLKHNLSRFSSPMEGHGGSFLKTWLFVFIGLFPFVIFLPKAMHFLYVKKLREYGDSISKNSFLLFATLAGFIILIFFSFASTRLPNYTVPAYPWFMMLLAVYFGKVKSISPLIFVWGLSLLFVLTIAFGGYFGLAEISYLSDNKRLAIYFLAGLVPLIFSMVFIRKKQKLRAFAGVSLSYATVSFIFFLSVMPALDQQNPVLLTKSIWDKGERVYYYENFNPAFVFYLRAPIERLDPFTAKSGDLIISRKKYLPKLESEGYLYEIIAEENDLFESPITVILRLNSTP
ncbi:ArnT family glycosyltransferase [Belliella aquatica]|nr:glycosyltransferase family 39 protein [Belliella aquatica]MCH7407115.1 glycosyltransferase family 39 protein [Belliella aquatica]